MLSRIFLGSLVAAAFFLGVSACHPVMAQMKNTSSRLSQLPPNIESAKDFFQRFDANPEKVMNEIPVKLDRKGNKVNSTKFNFNTIQNKNFISAKDKIRNKFCPTDRPGQPCVMKKDKSKFFAAFDWNNLPLSFLNDPNLPEEQSSQLVDLFKLNSSAGTEGAVNFQPWSGDYWPTYKGGTGARTTDPRFPMFGAWKDYWNFYVNTITPEMNSKNFPEGIDRLSPAEKYDLLLGLNNFPLSSWSWSDAKTNENDKGEVEMWFGLCHGWAPASFMEKRPKQSTQVQLPSGETLKFTPDDMKALATLAWARNRLYDTDMFMGGRCNDKNPKKDSNGRIISAECWDVNPGAWHISVLNRVGINKKSFVLDATYDYEVWNQPINSFSVTYFNVNTKEEFSSPQEAIIERSEIQKDTFKKYRTKNYKKIVGVKMTISYMSETAASPADFDDAAYDHAEYVTYMYDLELDKDSNIVGGEWYNNAHPDFIWYPKTNSESPAPTEYSNKLGDWVPGTALPPEILQNIQSDASQGYPYYQVIEKLLNQSQ